MKHLYLLALSLLLSFSLQAQVLEKSNDTIPISKQLEHSDGQLSTDPKESKVTDINATLNPQVPTFNPLPPLRLSDLNITWNDINRLEYKGPPTQLSSSRQPYTNDYGLYALYGLNENLYLTTSSTRRTQIGTDISSTIGAQLNFRATDWLTISGGPSVSKVKMYDMYNYNTAGFNAAMKFKLNDRFSINTFGEYHQKEGPMGAQKSYGGALEYRISDKFGVGAGMERELNPFTGKWVNKPIIYPIFY